MEFPTLITNDLMFLAVLVLALAPLFSLFGTYKIGKVYYSDIERPRNRLLRRMFSAGVAISLAGLYVMALSFGYLMTFFDGDTSAPIADFGGLTFAIVLIVVFYQPFLNWRALVALNGNVEILKDIPETQEQSEDRQFGTQRRKLEAEHIATKAKLDKKLDQ